MNWSAILNGVWWPDINDPSPFFEILAENGDFLVSETGAYLIIE